MILENKEKCTGCSACYSICPSSCIKMMEDNEGFRYPTVDKEHCIKCGLCRKVCPVVQTTVEKSVLPKAIIGYSKNIERRTKSASGGAFAEIAAYAINENKAVVFGAAYTDDFVVNHIAIERIEDIPRLQKSKYVQSNIDNCYRQASDFLKNGRNVLFSGTPCQIYGLKSYLKIKNIPTANLFCIDIICHGTPSPKANRSFINAQEKAEHSKMMCYQNRQKKLLKYSYQNITSQVFENGKIKESSYEKDEFISAFFSDLISRPSCYACPFKTGRHDSDVTVGDFWFSQEIPEIGEDKLGVSLILLQSEKSNEIIEECTGLEQFNIDSEVAMKCSGGMMCNSVSKNPRRDEFFSNLTEDNFLEIYKKYGKKDSTRKKIKQWIRNFLVWKLDVYPKWQFEGKRKDYIKRCNTRLSESAYMHTTLSNYREKNS